MNLWQEPSLIDQVIPLDWERAWAAGEARLLPVSPQGGLVVGSSEDGVSGLVWRDSIGERYDPDRHFFVGVAALSGAAASRGVAAPIFAVAEECADQVSLREALAELGGLDLEIGLRAAALVQYHVSNRFCPGCGNLTDVTQLGRQRFCPECQIEHFPRTDPAVIVIVTDDDDRLLLCHNRAWEPARRSILAGFVEAGESLEQAVYREILEEVSIEVCDLRYVGSQPWPVPRSLMIGFAARAVSTGIQPDQDEITTATWFTRAELREAIEGCTVRLPLPMSIGHHLITGWLTNAPS
jgi:NAD+ diphosphatase